MRFITNLLNLLTSMASMYTDPIQVYTGYGNGYGLDLKINGKWYRFSMVEFDDDKLPNSIKEIES